MKKTFLIVTTIWAAFVFIAPAFMSWWTMGQLNMSHPGHYFDDSGNQYTTATIVITTYVFVGFLATVLYAIASAVIFAIHWVVKKT